MEATKTEYKRTKVGSIPSDWEVKKFGEVFDFIKTSSHSKKQMTYDDTESQIYNVHYGAIHTTYKEQILDFEKYNVPRITDDSPMPRTDQFLRDGDLVIVDASEDWDGMGECVELKNIGDKKVIGGLHTYAVRDNKGLFAKGFAGYIFQNTAVRNRLASYANISKVYGITKGNITIVPLVIPPLREQQKIAKVLSTIDEQISATECIIEKSTELKKGLMQKLFSEGIGHTDFKDTKIGRIPKEWVVVNLGSVLTKIVGGGTPSRRNPEYWNGKIPWASVKDFTAPVKSDTFEHISQAGLSNSSANLIPKGTLIIPTRMGLGRIIEFEVDVSINQDLKALFPKDSVLKDYLKYWLLNMAPKIEMQGTGSTVKGIRLELLRALDFILPTIKEQQKIADILSEADKKIEKEEQYKSELEQLKKGLMQQLLTGQKRVKV